MLSKIIQFSIKNKVIILLCTAFIILFGLYSLSRIPIGAVPDVTNNQVQVITTSRNLSTQDMEQFITYPVELEMANLPGVTEIRSVSKFGLSVVTVVFEDNMGTFLPRQLITEKIKSASEKIPEGFGSPELGPITTGLGEIYQYILDVKPEFKHKYSTTDLRTIQDWIVKRQLSGIKGVVEVNTWGGYLKQYEVAINTQKLNAMNITASEVFSALEKNNSVAGGGYIEKVNQSYFIRGEGLIGNLDDVKNIVVKTVDGMPIYINDIAKVRFGSAMRFGAITGNGEGEKVLGQIMMLKDGNSKKIIEAVRDRVASIEKSLPQGVYINPVLDRSELIGRTTFTITENLILGSLIVIFVVILLLGNWRSGLVVASVIPLSLLFALSMMYIFDVDANLMSLGAIDFGIIIDGAVIIVEFITFSITKEQSQLSKLSKSEQRELKDKITFKGASKMMNSAVFGQLIILIVFIPILSLQGVEGKMFIPMALTFSFALIGAMFLCFSYVPVMSSLFLRPTASKQNLSQKLINFLHKIYEPALDFALAQKRLIILISVILLIFSGLLYTRMGGEFVPTLDEGDFVIQPVLKTGTSLSKTIATTTKIEKILLNNFPEVNQVVSRIGAAEVPTDPMSMEESDVIITLKPKSEWTSASSKDELADKFKEALTKEIAGIEIEFTQPIEMRFNELITGVRADIAIKIFGEDLEILAKKGDEIKKLIEKVDGASDITIEKVEGLPQMNVSYNRAKITRYGLNIEDVNSVLSMGFAGKAVGNVFEGEKRFDLVVRLDNAHRKSINDIKDMYIDLPNGGKVQLSELASITEKKGAAKISRDDTRRRVVVGINVRNRDLQSVVDDVQKIINEKVKIPAGYSITYGGQFENLQSASKRLLIVVPIALLLIFIMLYFAFKSLKDALIIYSAIPLAAVGGVLFLWIRGLPFSISAGVGFIALFGIAVLNGIVLIEHFKELKNKYNDMETLIKQGTLDRMRAVLLTAMAAALGFLPMAVSTNAGAEVQRPLATVVIGGLLTSTLLTLIVLPVLYAYFNKGIKLHKKSATVAILLLFSVGINAQGVKKLDDLIPLAMENNAHLRAGNLQIEQAKSLKGTAFLLDKTEVYYNYDQSNVVDGKPLKVFGISQDFQFPTIYGINKRILSSEVALKTLEFNIIKKQITKELAQAYYTYQFKNQRVTIYKSLDSLYTLFSSASDRKFELGESNYLEKVTAKAQHKKVKIQFEQAKIDVKIADERVKTLVQSEEKFTLANEPVKKLKANILNVDNIEEIQLQEQRIALKKAMISLEKQQYLPDITAEYFQGTNNQISKHLHGYKIGLKIPLFFWGKSAKVKSAKIAHTIAQLEKESSIIILKHKYEKLISELRKHEQALMYYETEGLALSEEIFRTAERSFKHGAIDFFQYIQSIENAYTLKIDYLEQLHKYNETIISINYLTF